MKKVKLLFKFLLTIFFISVGVKHFTDKEFFLKIMPPYLPWHLELVYISGVIEVMLGILLLVPKLTRAAAWGMIALMIAVYPANIHMAVNNHLYPDIPPVLLYIRLPMQFLFIAWAYWFTRSERELVNPLPD